MGRDLKWSDVVVLSFWGCFTLILFCTIPVLAFFSGLVMLINGHVFWGICICILGLMSLVGPFYATWRSKYGDEKPAEEKVNE